MVWPVDFDYLSTDPSSAKFVAAYQAMFNENPFNYAAEAYDAVWFLASSIKDADSADRRPSRTAWPPRPARPPTERSAQPDLEGRHHPDAGSCGRVERDEDAACSTPFRSDHLQ